MIKKVIVYIILGVFMVTGSNCSKNERTYNNPIIAGFYPDPSICKVDDDFYLVNSSFSYFPGLPIFHSKDLVNWEQIGNVMERPEQMELKGLGLSKGLYAPAISYHEGTFYVVCTLVGGKGNYVVTTDDPAGDWSKPVWFPRINGIDPSLFFDNDGKAYIVYNSIAPDNDPLYRGHRTIRMYEFDYENMQLVGEEKILVNGGVDISKKPIWIEGPHIYRVNDYYYLMAAEGGTAEDHSEVIFRSRNVDGSYKPGPINPILTQRHLDPNREYPITCTGHADIVEAKPGEWWAVFLGCRPYQPFNKNYYNTGRETFMAPVEWQDGWPVINPNYEEVQYSYPAPDLPEKELGDRPYSGNFTIRDNFDYQVLDDYWLFLRVPTEEWYTLKQNPAALQIDLRPETCSEKVNPSFIGHRQQHQNCDAIVSMDFTNDKENEKAGLTIFQNEAHYYYLCKSVEDDKPVVQLFQADTGRAENIKLLVSDEIPAKRADQTLLLKIEARESNYAFSYAFEYEEGEINDWTLLQDNVDGTILSTKVAGGFVGSVFSMYATSLGKPSDNQATFKWFEYTGNDPVYK